MVTGGFTKEEEKKHLKEQENVTEVLVYLIDLPWITDIL